MSDSRLRPPASGQSEAAPSRAVTSAFGSGVAFSSGVAFGWGSALFSALAVVGAASAGDLHATITKNDTTTGAHGARLEDRTGAALALERRIALTGPSTQPPCPSSKPTLSL